MTISSYLFVRRDMPNVIECANTIIDTQLFELDSTVPLGHLIWETIHETCLYPCLVTAVMSQRVHSVYVSLAKEPSRSSFVVDRVGRGTRGQTVCLFALDAHELGAMLALLNGESIVSAPLQPSAFPVVWTDFLLGLDPVETETLSQSVYLD
jgi:hypothetical protein